MGREGEVGLWILRTSTDGQPVAAVFWGEHHAQTWIVIAVRPPVGFAALEEQELLGRRPAVVLDIEVGRPIFSQLIASVLHAPEVPGARLNSSAFMLRVPSA